MTALTKAVSRETSKLIGNRPIIITIAPLGSQSEARIGLRLKGTRAQYVVLLSDVFRNAALQHGRKEAQAKREARKAGTAWRIARKAFVRANSI